MRDTCPSACDSGVDEEIHRNIATVKALLNFEASPERVLRWWEAFELRNESRPGLVLQVLKEIERRGATLHQYYLSYLWGRSDNIQAVLDHLDYKRAEMGEFAADPADRALTSEDREELRKKLSYESAPAYAKLVWEIFELEHRDGALTLRRFVEEMNNRSCSTVEDIFNLCVLAQSTNSKALIPFADFVARRLVELVKSSVIGSSLRIIFFSDERVPDSIGESPLIGRLTALRNVGRWAMVQWVKKRCPANFEPYKDDPGMLSILSAFAPNEEPKKRPLAHAMSEWAGVLEHYPAEPWIPQFASFMVFSLRAIVAAELDGKRSIDFEPLTRLGELTRVGTYYLCTEFLRMLEGCVGDDQSRREIAIRCVMSIKAADSALEEDCLASLKRLGLEPEKIAAPGPAPARATTRRRARGKGSRTRSRKPSPEPRARSRGAPRQPSHRARGGGSARARA